MSLKIESTSSAASENLIRIFLQGRNTGILATADKAAAPYASVVYYLLEDDFSMLFGTKEATQKYQNLIENDQVSLVVYEESTQTTALVLGHVEIIDDQDVRERVIKNMSKSSAEGSMTEIMPAERLVAGDYKVFRLNPTVIKMAEYNLPTPGADDIFERILFSNN